MNNAKQAEELAQLNDKLNLTGRVFRISKHAIKQGGCAYIWVGVLVDRGTEITSIVSVTNGSDPVGESVAVKVIREVGTSAGIASLKRRLIREIRAWSVLHHRNVLTLLGFTYHFEAHCRLPSLVSPWMPNGTSRDYLKDQNKSECIRILTGVADGLCYLHRHDVVHGDLKGDNILIDERLEPRLADFGLSKLMTEVDGACTATETAEVCGSLRWMARELFETESGVTRESDVWAFGMTILELFTGLAPYHYYRTDGRVITSVIKGELPNRPEPDIGLEDELWNLCCKCWHENPELRPSMRTITKDLWDQDLRCKLRSRRRRRRRESDSPERTDSTSTTGSTTDSSVDGDEERAATVFDGRLHKSPRLSLLAELGQETQSSPGTPLAISRALVRTPTPRSASSSSPSSNVPSRFTSRRPSGSNYVDPRHLFTVHSEGDFYSSTYGYHPQNHLRRARPSRGYTEPSTPSQLHFSHDVTGLGLDAGISGGSQFDPRLEMPLALVSSQEQDFYDTFNERTPRQTTLPLEADYPYIHPPILSHVATEPDRFDYLDASLVHSAVCPHTYYVPHPSQWASFYNPFAHTPPPPSHYGLFHHDNPSEMGAYHPASYVTPPNRQISSSSVYPSPFQEYSPQQSPIPLHSVGPIFSEAFAGNFGFDESFPYPSPPLNAKQNMHSYPSHAHGSGRSTVDFISMQHGVLSPTLSDAYASPQPAHTQLRPPLPVESPLFSDLDSFDTPESGLFSDLALFGGVEEGGDSLFAADYGGASEEPHGSPQLLSTVLPLTRSPLSDGHGELQPQRLPPTPRLSPLLSDF